MKKALTLVLLCALGLTSCGKAEVNFADESGIISAAANSEKVKLNENMLLENGSPAEWLERYGDPIYYVNGTRFEFTLPDNADPDSVKVTDTVINADGEPKYDIKAASREPEYFDVWNGVVSFRLEGHPAAFLSSYLADYETGACLRSFDIEFVSEGEEYKYTFCIRSDASFDVPCPETEPIVYEIVEVNGDTYIADCTADEWLKQKGEPPYYPYGTIFRIVPPNGGEVRKISCTEYNDINYANCDPEIHTTKSDVDFEVTDGSAEFTLEANYISSFFFVWRSFDITVDFGEDTRVYTFCVSEYKIEERQ